MLIRTLKEIPSFYKYGLKYKHMLLEKSAKKAHHRNMESNEIHKLQFGSGQNHLKGWFNTDYFPRENIFF